MQESDYLVKAITKNGAFRAIAVFTKHLTEEARERHKLSHTCTVALGRAFACGILLCNTLRKTKGHLTLKIKGNGEIGNLIVDVSNEGTVRGYVDNTSLECFDEKGYISVSRAIGKNGYLHVSYDKEKGIPYTGSVELVTGEVGDDVANYLAKSEQINSFVSCGIYLEPSSGKVLHSGGIVIQRMPGASEEDIKKLEDTVSKLDPFTILLRAGLSLEEIIKKSLINFEIDFLSEFEGLCFHCSCSHERFEGAIKMLGKDEIEKIISNVGYAEGTCNFCNNIYQIKKEDLEKILSEMNLY